jgi:hypothetical protein
MILVLIVVYDRRLVALNVLVFTHDLWYSIEWFVE